LQENDQEFRAYFLCITRIAITHSHFQIDKLRDYSRDREVHLYALQRSAAASYLNSSCSLFIGKLNEPETQSGRASDIHNCPIGNIHGDHQNYCAERFQGKDIKLSGH